MNERKAKLNYPINEKIIVITNEPYSEIEPNNLIIGKISGYEEIHDKYYIKYISEGNEFMALTEPLPYSEELENALNKLTWDERWNIFSRGWSIITKKDKERKENENHI